MLTSLVTISAVVGPPIVGQGHTDYIWTLAYIYLLKYILPKAKYILPKAKYILPKAKYILPKAKYILPKAKYILPKAAFKQL